LFYVYNQPCFMQEKNEIIGPISTNYSAKIVPVSKGNCKNKKKKHGCYKGSVTHLTGVASLTKL